MKVFHGIDRLPAFRHPAATVGSFDGVHGGHSELLAAVRRFARERDGESIVVTFSPHPRIVLETQTDLRLLTTLDEKVWLLERAGIDNLVVIPFTREFSRTGSADFIRRDLIGKLGVETLVMGYNHHFGHNKEGDYGSLRSSERPTLRLYRIEPFSVGGEKVSSTVVRSLVEHAEMARAARMLGHPYLLMADVAHYAGLIAAGVYPTPFGYADIVTTTTHKSLRGPRGGLIFCRPDLEKQINMAVFPGVQGGPLMHVIAAKAVAFGEALKPEYKEYQQQVIKNAAAMADALTKRGLRIVSGRTQSHVMLVDLRSKNITGKEAETVLHEVGITVNKNSIPNDPQKPFVTSGIRLGSPAMTTRGFKENEAIEVANLIADVLDAPKNEQVLANVKERVASLVARFPVYLATV